MSGIKTLWFPADGTLAEQKVMVLPLKPGKEMTPDRAEAGLTFKLRRLFLKAETSGESPETVLQASPALASLVGLMPTEQLPEAIVQSDPMASVLSRTVEPTKARPSPQMAQMLQDQTLAEWVSALEESL